MNGTVTATSGEIGGFTVTDNKLSTSTTVQSTVSQSGIIYAGGSTPNPTNTAWFGLLNGVYEGSKRQLIVSHSWNATTGAH